MILQANGGHYLTESDEALSATARHFVKTVHLNTPADAARWREVTEAQKQALLTPPGLPEPEATNVTPAYLDRVEQLLAAIPATMNQPEVQAAFADTATALRYQGYYPEWGAEGAELGKEVPAGFHLRSEGKLYQVRQPHTLQKDWQPGREGTAALYERIEPVHAGTLEDPVPYTPDGTGSTSQALEAGKYYTQDGVTYLCTRDSGQPLIHALADLVGIYVEPATDTEDAPATTPDTPETTGDTTDTDTPSESGDNN